MDGCCKWGLRGERGWGKWWLGGDWMVKDGIEDPISGKRVLRMLRFLCGLSV